MLAPSLRSIFLENILDLPSSRSPFAIARSPSWRPTRQWLRVGIGLVLSGVVAVMIMFQGYCWAWWGTESLLLQHLFQCACPPTSEQTRYEPFTVLASACTHPRVRSIAPEGTALLIAHQQPQEQLIHIHLETGQQRVLDLPSDTIVHLLTRDLILVTAGTLPETHTYELLNVQSQTRRALRRIAVGNQPLAGPTRQLVQQADQIYVVDNAIVVLAGNATGQAEQGAVIVAGATSDLTATLQTLTDAGITYHHVGVPGRHGNDLGKLYTQDGRAWADRDGIHLDPSPQPVVATERSDRPAQTSLTPVAWVQQDQAVVYTWVDPFVINWGGRFRFFSVPQPVVLLKVPR